MTIRLASLAQGFRSATMLAFLPTSLIMWVRKSHSFALVWHKNRGAFFSHYPSYKYSLQIPSIWNENLHTTIFQNRCSITVYLRTGASCTGFSSLPFNKSKSCHSHLEGQLALIFIFSWYLQRNRVDPLPLWRHSSPPHRMSIANPLTDTPIIAKIL